MNAAAMLNRISSLGLTLDQARVIVSLTRQGLSVAQIRGQCPGLTHSVIDHMRERFLVRTKVGREYLYRLGPDGLQVAKLLFAEETQPAAPSPVPDSPPLPFV